MASFPASIPSFRTTLIPSVFTKEKEIGVEVESICTQMGTVPATAPVALAIATATTSVTIKIASGSVRTITNPRRAGTCAITVSTTGATHGCQFHIYRTGSTGAAGATISVNGKHTFTASKACSCNLKFIGTAWLIESIWQGA